MTSRRRTDGVHSRRRGTRRDDSRTIGTAGARGASLRPIPAPARRQGRPPVRTVAWTVVCGIAVVGVVCCACGGPASSAAPRAGHPVTRGASPSTAASGGNKAGSAGERRDVISAWVAAERTVYRYNDEPAGPLQAELQAGESSSSLFPELATYFTGPALTTVMTFLVDLKMNLLRGPVSYNLGHPRVVDLTATTATVESCVFDTGTTTESGAPGPPALDGGGRGSYSGTWTLDASDGRWRITRFETHSGPKC